MLRKRPVETSPHQDPAWIVKLYSENPRLLRKAQAALDNVNESAYNKFNVTELDRIYKPLKRALCAFADGLAEERK